MTSSVVSWERDTSGECPDEDEGSTPITGSSTSTTINGREESSRYFITVTVFNDAGSSEVSNTVTAVTEEAGEMQDHRHSGHIVFLSIPPAPSAAPTSVSTSSESSSSITVQWEMVPCIHRNGDITGYSVKYSGETVSVSGDDVTEVTITGLTASTTYSVQVAAVNDAGTGSLSSSRFTVTLGNNDGID